MELSVPGLNIASASEAGGVRMSTGGVRLARTSAGGVRPARKNELAESGFLSRGRGGSGVIAPQ
jgi:hypothetical protein